MRFAYNYLHTMFSKAVDACKDLDEKIRLLHTYRDAFFDQFEVMYIETNDLGESYVIFETLNARGKELETSDLLKNYVFSKAGGNLQTVQQNGKYVLEASWPRFNKVHPVLLECYAWGCS